MAARLARCCCLLVLPFASNSLLQTVPGGCAGGGGRLGPGSPRHSAGRALRDGGGGGGRLRASPETTKLFAAGEPGRVNGVVVGAESPRRRDNNNIDPKDEALVQAQTAVSSLESALDAAVGSLENVQRQLQMQVMQLEGDLETTRVELGTARTELERANAELASTRDELIESTRARVELEKEVSSGRDAARRVEQLEAYVATLKEVRTEMPAVPPAVPSAARKEAADNNNPWQQIFSSNQRVVPVLNDWIAIRGANEGEIQISGKVANHPTIPDGDAIVTSPLVDPGGAIEKKIVTTLSGSRYRLASPMTMPSSDSASVKITSSSPEKKRPPPPPRQQLVRARSSITIPDMTGGTIGNGRYLLAGEATSSINGRSYIQTAYRASPFGKPMGEPLAVKYSQNKEAMKREYANYQKVSLGLKGGSFVRRAEFLPVAGEEMPDMSALVMQRGVADVKAFMPKVGGKLEGELLLDCALTALRCMEGLHSVRLVWNDLKTENFVVIDDQRGGVSFRGIDLESCMTVNTAPVDYTPEACPPEFARSFLKGDADSFGLEYSYDVWSFGMFLYEVTTGRGFFDGMSAQKITMTLPTFKPNLAKVADPVLADLISQCLSREPKDRPSVARIFKHPFFAGASTGKNAFDFLFGINI